MDDLIAFLRARLYEDEAHARFAFADHNDAGPNWTEIWSGTVDTGDDHIATGDAGLSRHIERFDPARVLAEVAAKRQIIEEGDLHDTTDASVLHRSVLKLLALPYADHPDYRDSWRP